MVKKVFADMSLVLFASAVSVEWQDQAACLGDPEPFFLATDERGKWKRDREALAKSICAGCPVRRLCLAQALDLAEPYGVWGGTTPEDRAVMTGRPVAG